MKGKLFKHSIILTLLVCSLLLLANQAVLAAKPAKALSVVINAVVVDFINGKILVTGSGLNTVNDATLGGVAVPAIDISNIDDGNLELAFSATMAGAVQSAGSYSLVLNGNAFSVYISSAIIDPSTAACPCEGFWESYGSALPDAGFSGLEPYCTFESGSGDQVGVEFWNPDTFQLWILTSEFNTTAKECALVIDEPTQTLSSPQEHAVCSSYLKTNFIDIYSAPDCGSLPSFP